MPKTANKISFLVDQQLPDFINEEYELFGKFIQKYYEQLEIQGQPTILLGILILTVILTFMNKTYLDNIILLMLLSLILATQLYYKMQRVFRKKVDT